MKISEITEQELIEYAREDSDNPEVFKTFNTILSACKSFIRGYTGLTDEQLDAREDLTIVMFVLSVEMYENRTFTIENDKVNVVVKSILDMHSFNLL